jgi:hypothetical protein
MLEESKLHPTTFIDAFVDFSWKRLFSTEESKPILIGLLNHLFKGRKFIVEIDYGKMNFRVKMQKKAGLYLMCTV